MSIHHDHWAHLPATATMDPHGLGVLDESACLSLLGTRSIGRLGFSAGALPVVFPVNFVLDGESVVFRTESGEKLRAAEQGAVACFQADDIDPFSHTGWSVLVTGRLGVVGEDRGEWARSLPLVPWGPARSGVFVELPVELASGRVLTGPPSSPIGT